MAPIPTISANDAAMNRLRAQNAAYTLHQKYQPEDLKARQLRGWYARWERLAREQAIDAGNLHPDDAEISRRANLLIKQHMTKARMAGLAKQRGVQPDTIQRVKQLAHPTTVCPTCWRTQHPRRAWPASYSTALCERHASDIKATQTHQPAANRTNDLPR